ncbi:MAG: MerR family transcriptional regulator [Caldilinea sp. CFX5]|nr:MerR family transcriptional regulator [Caldilinea sp. CFX5]
MTSSLTTQTLLHHPDRELRYAPADAARLAGLTLRTLERYRQAGLVTPTQSADNRWIYSAADVERLACIQRLRAEAHLSLEAVEVVLHMRTQLFDLQRTLEEFRRQMLARERELQTTIHQLRQQAAVESGWR